MNIAMTVMDWLHLLGHYLELSLLAVGGAITLAPDMHRYLVVEQHWLTNDQFTSSIALAQAAPGPNMLFIALLGWNVGLNAGGGLAAGSAAWGWGLLGAATTMGGILLPSTTLALTAARWGYKNRELLSVRAFKAGMAPIVIALLGATAWVLSLGEREGLDNWRLWLLTLVCTVLVWRTRIHLLWLLALGAVLGWFGLV